jgi:polysaccharide pyruvyl transferase WcaK-like protein
MKTSGARNEATRWPKCILWGGYALGNVGDELALAIALRDMTERYGLSAVAVLSPFPGYTKALFPESKVIPYAPAPAPERNTQVARVFRFLKRLCGFRRNRYDVNSQFRSETSSGWAEAIKGCELLYLVGGGYLTDLFDVERLVLPVEVARFHGVKVETAPLGIGPFKDPWNARKIQGVLRDAHVRVRDIDSQLICNDLGMTTELRQDDGFRVQEVVAIDAPVTIGERPIGINFYTQHGGNEAETLISWWRGVLILLKSSGLPVEGFCFHNSLQIDFSQTAELFADAGLPTRLVRPPYFDFRDACIQLSGYRAILTARFHAAVVAGVVGIPAIAVADGQYYRAKMVSACQGYPASRAVDISVTEPTEILQALQRAALPDANAVPLPDESVDTFL